MLTPEQWRVLYRALLDAQAVEAVRLHQETIPGVAAFHRVAYERTTEALEIAYRLPVDWSREAKAA